MLLQCNLAEHSTRIARQQLLSLEKIGPASYLNCCSLYSPAIDYIQYLHKEKKKQEEEVSTLRKDVMALKIMKV